MTTKPKSNKGTINVPPNTAKRAKVAASLLGQSLKDFAVNALDASSGPILKKHGVSSIG